MLKVLAPREAVLSPDWLDLLKAAFSVSPICAKGEVWVLCSGPVACRTCEECVCSCNHWAETKADGCAEPKPYSVATPGLQNELVSLVSD